MIDADYEVYVILDKGLLGNRDLRRFAEKLVDNGVRMIQYRDKISSYDEIRRNSYRLTEACIPVFIINDYPEIAKEVGANGVHLGQDDMSIDKARIILGEGKLIGRSTHNLSQVVKADKEGVDYISIGPVFHTDTKKGLAPVGLDVVGEAVEQVTTPIVAIGGINLDNMDMVLDHGVSKIAMASAILDERFSWDRYRKQLKARSQKR